MKVYRTVVQILSENLVSPMSYKILFQEGSDFLSQLEANATQKAKTSLFLVGLYLLSQKKTSSGVFYSVTTHSRQNILKEDICLSLQGNAHFSYYILLFILGKFCQRCHEAPPQRRALRQTSLLQGKLYLLLRNVAAINSA